MVTRADVAKRAGVSPSTVSYVLNGQRPTSLATQERVKQAIADLGYVPHRWAGNLAAHSLRTVGLHFSVGKHGIDRIAGEYITGMYERAEELDIMLMMPVFTSGTPELFQKFIHSGVVDALVMMEVSANDWREPLVMAADIPAIFLGSPQTHRLPFIESDFVDIGARAIGYIAKRGHRKVLLVTRAEERSDFVRASDLMRLGIQKAQRNHAIDVEELRLPSHAVSAFTVIDSLKNSAEHLAVVGDNREALETLVSISPRFGLRPGRDYSILSLAGNYSMGNDVDQLTSESGTDRHAMGRACIDHIRAHFDGTLEQREVYFPAIISERGTVA